MMKSLVAFIFLITLLTSCNTQKQRFIETKTINDIEIYNQFLLDYPDSKYSNEIRTSIIRILLIEQSDTLGKLYDKLSYHLEYFPKQPGEEQLLLYSVEDARIFVDFLDGLTELIIDVGARNYPYRFERLASTNDTLSFLRKSDLKQLLHSEDNYRLKFDQVLAQLNSFEKTVTYKSFNKESFDSIRTTITTFIVQLDSAHSILTDLEILENSELKDDTNK